MSDYRIEADSIGEVRVPRAALYAAQTQRARENFPISGMRPWPAFIWSIALIKRAAAEVNMELGLLDEKLARAIIAAGDEIVAGQHHEHFVVDPFQAGAGTSHNMNANEVMANRANQLLGYAVDAADKPVHPNDHVNMAQSTNDTIPTAIRLGALWRLDELLGMLSRFVSVTREQGGRVGRCSQDGADASAGRGADSAGAGSGRLGHGHRARQRQGRGRGRGAAAAGHRRDGGRHRLERAPAVSRAHGGQAVGAERHPPGRER